MIHSCAPKITRLGIWLPSYFDLVRIKAYNQIIRRRYVDFPAIDLLATLVMSPYSPGPLHSLAAARGGIVRSLSRVDDATHPFPHVTAGRRYSASHRDCPILRESGFVFSSWVSLEPGGVADPFRFREFLMWSACSKLCTDRLGGGRLPMP